MRGICFIEQLFKLTVFEKKTVTRRRNDTYKVGEILYLKEPYVIESDKIIRYKYSSINPEKEKWENKLFMPEIAARYYIEIISKRRERLQEITEDDCIKEGIKVGRCGNKAHWIKAFYVPGDNQPYITAQLAYKKLINSIYDIDIWDTNPSITRYEYVMKHI